ncbi:MAG: hypothetical protein GWM98_13320 [Nitrospinaceae bacterium]|nr:hypothetical protein [Nitrospinaceae bacterium]NIR55270.1 hypothetical protein [Nitrospinaceae bacterium]NIS85708.1 hypothetical protein [Nitrospinaceae bacterium]NIT82559.1 hypothetical protein [Nitrospinaceae bacterium]NIU44763.1 hypothetical protein [Nitrospinaceae bacterium]
MDDLLKAMKFRPEDHEIVLAVCNVYGKKRYYTVAIQHCEKALNLDSDDHRTMNRLAWLYAKKQIHLEKAMELSRKTLQAFPDRPEYIDTLSELYYVQGKIDQAVENIKIAIDLVPDEIYYKQQLWKFKNVKPKPLPKKQAETAETS